MQLEDWASDIEQRERDEAIKRCRQQPNELGNGICHDCFESVEVQRGNALRCVSCQQDFDHRQRVRNGGRRV